MSAGELLARFIPSLDAAGIPYMITGSFASTFHGTPRTTHDIDIVIEPTMASLDRWLAQLPTSDYYVDVDTAREALRHRAQFNVIDIATGWKIDCIVRKARPFSVEEFARREPAELMGVPVFVATAEDTIIAKLEWAKLGDSDRQRRDVEGMLGVLAAKLDYSYIERWIDELELRDEWTRVTRDH